MEGSWADPEAPKKLWTCSWFPIGSTSSPCPLQALLCAAIRRLPWLLQSSNQSSSMDSGRLTQLCPSISFESIQHLICHTGFIQNCGWIAYQMLCNCDRAICSETKTIDKFQAKEHWLRLSLSYMITSLNLAERRMHKTTKFSSEKGSFWLVERQKAMSPYIHWALLQAS